MHTLPPLVEIMKVEVVAHVVFCEEEGIRHKCHEPADTQEVSDVEKGYLRCLDRKMILLIRLNALDSLSKRLRRAEPIVRLLLDPISINGASRVNSPSIPSIPSIVLDLLIKQESD